MSDPTVDLLLQIEGEFNRAASEVPPEAFKIDSAERADWYLRKLAAIDAERALVAAQAAKIDVELVADRARLERRYQAELEEWARAEIAESRRRSVALLHGTVALRTVAASVKITDEAAALQWARENRPELVVTSQRIDARAYTKIVREDGEALPGITLTPAREAFRIMFPTTAREQGPVTQEEEG